MLFAVKGSVLLLYLSLLRDPNGHPLIQKERAEPDPPPLGFVNTPFSHSADDLPLNPHS